MEVLQRDRRHPGGNLEGREMSGDAGIRGEWQRPEEHGTEGGRPSFDGREIDIERKQCSRANGVRPGHDGTERGIAGEERLVTEAFLPVKPSLLLECFQGGGGNVQLQCVSVRP